jgi:3-deoxy-manno-octulosonate cytidylyltransferase (CMP-KDO synthetase)
MKIVGIIPCRYKSLRFPGKPLAIIAGKPMMWHVYQRALESNSLDEVYIATDDKRIKDSADSLGLNVLMTNSRHLTGTDRIAEASQYIDSEYFVNIQGDEPLINPDAIRAVSDEILCHSSSSPIKAVNAFSILKNKDDVEDSNVVKVITDINNNALAYSRHPIPYSKLENTIFYRQLGLYSFTKEALNIFIQSRPGVLEKCESVEMYRILENGYQVKMLEANDSSISVDTPEDLERIRFLIEE